MNKFYKKQANPGPLGLIGFGLTTILLSFFNAGIFSTLGADTLAMGIFVGGLMQVIAGLLEFKRGSTFAGTAFTMYGFFWISLVAVTVLPGSGTLGDKFVFDGATHGLFLTLWGVVTVFMTIGTLTHNKLSTVMFGVLAVTLLFLGAGAFTSVAILKTIGGVLGIISGLLAVYQAMAQVVNEEHGKTVLPLP